MHFLEFDPTYRNNERFQELLPTLPSHGVCVHYFLQPNCQLCGFTKASFPCRFPKFNWQDDKRNEFLRTKKQIDRLCLICFNFCLYFFP